MARVQMDAGEAVSVAPMIRPDPPTVQTAMAQAFGRMFDAMREDLIAESARRAEAGDVPRLREELAALQASLAEASAESAFRDTAKTLQKTGLSRKQAEAAARKAVSERVDEIQARIERLQNQIEANRSGSQAEQDLALLDQGKIPARYLAKVTGAASEIVRGFQERPISGGVRSAFEGAAEPPAVPMDVRVSRFMKVGLSAAKDVGEGLVPGTRTVVHDVIADGEKVGHISLESAQDGTLTAVYSLHVDPSRRGSGIGGEVMRQLLNSNHAILLEGVIDDAARKWWENRGAKVEGTRGRLEREAFKTTDRSAAEKAQGNSGHDGKAGERAVGRNEEKEQALSRTESPSPTARQSEVAPEIAQANQRLAENPDLIIRTEDGVDVKASDALRAADEEIMRAESEAQGFQAAIACALRFGE